MRYVVLAYGVVRYTVHRTFNKFPKGTLVAGTDDINVVGRIYGRMQYPGIVGDKLLLEEQGLQRS